MTFASLRPDANDDVAALLAKLVLLAGGTVSEGDTTPKQLLRALLRLT